MGEQKSPTVRSKKGVIVYDDRAEGWYQKGRSIFTCSKYV